MAGDSMIASIYVLLFPKSKSSQERVGVIACAATRRQLFQFFGVASSKNHVVGFEGVGQSGFHVRDVVLPFFLTELCQCARSDVILVSPLPIGQMAHFHEFDEAINNESRSETGPQAQK